MVGPRRWMMAVKGPWLLAALLLIDGAVLAFLPGDSTAYAYPIAEVVAAPERFRERGLRVQGSIATGSLRQAANRCEFAFRLRADDGAELPVRWRSNSRDAPDCGTPLCENPRIRFAAQGELAVTATGHQLLAHDVMRIYAGKYDMGPDAQPHFACPPRPVER